MYFTSIRTHSANVTSDRPSICQMQVRPGVTSRRRCCQRSQPAGFVHRQRPRADQRHVALEHVPQLRQLVDAGLAEEVADAGDPRVVLQLERRAVLLAALPTGACFFASASAHIVRNL